ncbi:MAG: hypothetical protein Q4G60_06120 [bacterium]|nr:hypothetical protein [bacterium]
MGYGSYTAGDWSKLKESRPSIASGSTNQIFTSNEMDSKFDPKFIDQREARDSEEHPFSTPLLIGVDVTGSMGYLSTQIIKESLNELMQKLYSTDMIRDPQLLFAAIGDATYDAAPLQITQFESDIRIAEQLLGLWLENGGGDSPEDYELLWYFAHKHTDIDCYNKRRQKGFCFTIGDADFHKELRADSIQRIFGDQSAVTVSSEELAKLASEKYELFHITIGDTTKNASDIIPGRVLTIAKSEIQYLPEVIISVAQLAKGMEEKEVLKQWGELARKVVKKSITLLCIGQKKEIHF